jgi:hypothetical protein
MIWPWPQNSSSTSAKHAGRRRTTSRHTTATVIQWLPSNTARSTRTGAPRDWRSELVHPNVRKVNRLCRVPHPSGPVAIARQIGVYKRRLNQGDGRGPAVPCLSLRCRPRYAAMNSRGIGRSKTRLPMPSFCADQSSKSRQRRSATLNATIPHLGAEKRKPNTAYTAGQDVIVPPGDVVTAATSLTSGASFSVANWIISPSSNRASSAGAVAIVLGA